MRLFLIENPQRLAWINNILLPVIPTERLRLLAADQIIQSDPTPQKKLAQWVAKLVIGGYISIGSVIKPGSNTQLRFPEDKQKMQEILSLFERSKHRLPVNQRDINKFKDFYSLEDILKSNVDTGAVRSAQMVKHVRGAEIIYNKPPYTIYMIERIRSYDTGLDDRTEYELDKINAVGVLGMGPPETSWCTRLSYGDEHAEEYLSYRNVYVIYKDGQPFIQKCGKQVMDANNRPATIPTELEHVIKQANDKSAGEQRRKILLYAEERVAQIRKPERTYIVMLGGSIIPCDKVADAGDLGDYYYVGVKLASRLPRRSVPTSMKENKRLFLEKNGFATFERISKFPNGKTSYRWDRLKNAYLPHGREEDSSSTIIKITPYIILTIGKENVAGIF